jgi:NAD(P)H dehydrogenase (quinone)
MIKPRIIVTGATGKTGSVVTTELLKAGYPVRAMVHQEDHRSARLRTQGAEIAVVEMSDVERVGGVQASPGWQRENSDETHAGH